MTAEYQPLYEDQIHVGTLAYVRVKLQDSQEFDDNSFWTIVVVNAVKSDSVEVSPVGSSSQALGMVDCLVLRRCQDGHIPLYKLKTP